MSTSFTIHSSSSSSSSSTPTTTGGSVSSTHSNSNNTTIEYAPRHSWGIGTLSRYQAIEQIGEGTYGQVYRARDTFTGAEVALKKMIKHHESEGFPKTETREIKILNSLRHPNMVHLKQLVTSMDVDESNLVGQSQAVITQSGPSQAALMAAAAAAATNPTSAKKENRTNTATTTSNTNTNDQPSATTDTNNPLTATNTTTNPPVVDKTGDIFMVFEYVDYDLTGLLDSEYKFEPKQIKVIVWQLLNVLDFLHNRNYVHRDLKCSNILLKDDHTVKLADFGLSRSLPNDSFEKVDMTYRVITLWYRPPELLLGSARYDSAIDLWSVGCIIMELFIGKPVLKANVEAEQIVNIMNILGAPPVDSSLRKCPGWSNFIQATGGAVEERKSRLTEWIQRYPSIAVDTDLVSLLTRLFEGDPRRRISAREALSSRYFRDIDSRKPLASLKGMLVKQNPTFRSGVDLHEFQAKKRRKDKVAGEQPTVTESMNVSTNVPPSVTNTTSLSSSSTTANPPSQVALPLSSSSLPNPPYPNNNRPIPNQPTPGNSGGGTSLLGSGPSVPHNRNPSTPNTNPTHTSSSASSKPSTNFTNSTVVPSQTLLATKFLSSLPDILRYPVDTIESRLRQLTNEFLNYFTPSWQPVIHRVTDSTSFARCTPQDIPSIGTALQIIKQDIDAYVNELYVLCHHHTNNEIRSRTVTYVDACNNTLARMVYDINRAVNIITTASVPSNPAVPTTTNWPMNGSTSGPPHHRSQPLSSSSSTVTTTPTLTNNHPSRHHDTNNTSSSSSSRNPKGPGSTHDNSYSHASSSSSSYGPNANPSTTTNRGNNNSNSGSSNSHRSSNPYHSNDHKAPYRNDRGRDRSYDHDLSYSSSRRSSDGGHHDYKKSRH